MMLLWSTLLLQTQYKIGLLKTFQTMLQENASQIWSEDKRMRKFGVYGFNESHNVFGEWLSSWFFLRINPAL
jgi:hypothetical protein